MKYLGNMSSFEIFSKHLISYSEPENFNHHDRHLFYDENFSFEIPPFIQLEFNDISFFNNLAFQNFFPQFWITFHRRPRLISMLKALFCLQFSKKKNLNLAILGFQDWANNYFHWMTEILPGIVAISHQHPSIPVVIPSNYLNHPFIVDSLYLLKIDFKIFDVKHSLNIDKLYTSAIPHVGRFNEGLMHFFRDKFIQNFTPSTYPNKLIYITRGKARRRRVSNEDEVFELLENNGFEKVALEDLHVKAQITLFQESKVVVASHGAGLTNIMFMQKGQSVIELKSDNNDYWCYFSLARVYKLKYFYILSKGSSLQHRDADILVDIDQLKKIVTQAMDN